MGIYFIPVSVAEVHLYLTSVKLENLEDPVYLVRAETLHTCGTQYVQLIGIGFYGVLGFNKLETVLREPFTRDLVQTKVYDPVPTS